MFLQNSIKLSAAVHELSCTQTILPYLATANKKSELMLMRRATASV